MRSELPADVKFEIGHVLFIDIVGYSKLLINEQSEQIQKLKEIVRGTEQVRLAEAEGKLLRLPTGDGGALVFRTTPEAPVLCALETARELRKHPELQVRMGIHSGPVNEVTDLNEQANITGAGVNIAQRVMDCGDAGHILVSRHVAEDLEHYPRWRSRLHDLGEIEVKHGLRIFVVNLYTGELGNSERPEKFKQRDRTPPGSRAPGKSIAVLPFENLSEEKANTYFADGIQEEILIRLSRIADLKVISRTSTQCFKSSPDNLPEIAKQLGVANILEGTVQKAADQVRVNVQLIDAENDSHVWAERYDRKLTDIFAVETDIAEKIADALQAKLNGAERRAISSYPTKNTEAHELYLKGRYHWNKRSEEGLRRAVAFFKDALDKDPAFARAWAGLADCYTVLGCWGFDAPHDSYPKAKTAAKEAIALDENLAEAHGSLAVTHKDYEWDWASAEREYRCALELNPSYALGHYWYGEYLACVGKHAEAIEQLERARELDPLSPLVASTLGRHGYYFARQFDRAGEELRKVTRSDAEFWIGHNFLGWVYTMKGQWPEAVEEFTIARQLDRCSETLVGLGYVFGLSGNSNEARKTLAELKRLRREHYVQPVSIALVHIGLGEKDDAFVWLDKAHEEHAQWLSEIKVDPAFDPLRSDARFANLLKRIGLE
jgi:adenylate cyclase